MCRQKPFGKQLPAGPDHCVDPINPSATTTLHNYQFAGRRHTKVHVLPPIMSTRQPSRLLQPQDRFTCSAQSFPQSTSPTIIRGVARTLLSEFCSESLPSISIPTYVRRFTQASCCSDASVINALILLRRVVKRSKFTMIGPEHAHRLVLTALTLATKSIDDSALGRGSAEYARIGGVNSTEMVSLEVALLKLLEFRTHVTSREHAECGARLILEYPVHGMKNTERAAASMEALLLVSLGNPAGRNQCGTWSRTKLLESETNVLAGCGGAKRCMPESACGRRKRARLGRGGARDGSYGSSHALSPRPAPAACA
jgi:hypothetical protein